MNDDMLEFRDAFFEEAAEHVSSVEQGLLRLDTGAVDAEEMNAVFRAVHSVKGLAATLGFAEIASFTHEFESVLDRLRGGTMVPTAELTQLLFRSNDTLRDLLAASRSDSAGNVDFAAVTAALKASLGGPPAPAPSRPAAAAPVAGEPRWYSVRFVPKPRLFSAGQDPMLLVREVAELGDEVSIVCDTTGLQTLDTLDPEQCQLIWVIKLLTTASREAISQVFLFVEDDCEHSIRDVTDDLSRAGVAANAPPLKTASGSESRPAVETSTIRVPTDKVDALVDLVGEMVISQAMVNQIAHGFDMSQLQQLQEALAALDRSTRELQERVMSVRMLPVATVFNRFPRLVRDTATRLGKKVRLDLIGAETELDKGMIERLGDPLTHLVRNAMDHGLETPDERVAAGKPETGVVALKAFHEGGNVIIEIDDDGRGLDKARIREKAIANGLIRGEDSLSDDEIHALIFAPGFSTAAQVSDLSGRGVGMDVVKRNVEALNGSVSLTSHPGKGSRVRIRLPLTLAILDGLIISLGGESYVLPLLSVVESMRPNPRDVRAILGGGEVLVVRGESIPFIRLHVVFGKEDAVTEPSQGIVVIAETDGRRFGLLVDEVIGQQQVVIKNLETNYRKLEAIMGATILGDGRVSLIADVQELYRFTSRRVVPDGRAALAGIAATADPHEDEAL
ncbi:MAG: chemotaxis protein CheA [Gemmatimonadaceae bacterium]